MTYGERRLKKVRVKIRVLIFCSLLSFSPTPLNQSHCDPRLNYEQSLDIAFLISHFLRGQRLKSNGRSNSVSRAPSRSSSLDRLSSKFNSASINGTEESGSEEKDGLLEELVQGISTRP